MAEDHPLPLLFKGRGLGERVKEAHLFFRSTGFTLLFPSILKYGCVP